jgi:anti-sigma factor RsiW
MNCKEIGELAPLHLSGELEGDQRDLFHQHLATCWICTRAMEQQAALDSRLRDVVSCEPSDTTRIERSVRSQIHAARVRHWSIAAAAAAILIAAVLGYRSLRLGSAERLYADAALDHRLEVMEHQPRRWRSDPAELAKLEERYEISSVNSLAPAGYHLEHAKMCGLAGQPALHLVYTNGVQEFSVFVRRRVGIVKALRTVTIGTEQLAAFETHRFEAVVATNASSEQCLQFAHKAASVL